MARKRSADNGHDRLAEAMTQLIQNEATFVARLAEADRHRVDIERQHLQFERETADRFVRIEAQMAEIMRVLSGHSEILSEHSRLLQGMAEAIREKIGFKAQS